jgi:hypothetical protein
MVRDLLNTLSPCHQASELRASCAPLTVRHNPESEPPFKKLDSHSKVNLCAIQSSHADRPTGKVFNSCANERGGDASQYSGVGWGLPGVSIETSGGWMHGPRLVMLTLVAFRDAATPQSHESVPLQRACVFRF